MLPVIDTYLSDTLILPEPPKKYKKPSKNRRLSMLLINLRYAFRHKKTRPKASFFFITRGPDQASPTEILPAMSSAVMVDSASMSAMW